MVFWCMKDFDFSILMTDTSNFVDLVLNQGTSIYEVSPRYEVGKLRRRPIQGWHSLFRVDTFDDFLEINNFEVVEKTLVSFQSISKDK